MWTSGTDSPASRSWEVEWGEGGIPGLPKTETANDSDFNYNVHTLPTLYQVYILAIIYQ